MFNIKNLFKKRKIKKVDIIEAITELEYVVNKIKNSIYILNTRGGKIKWENE